MGGGPRFFDLSFSHSRFSPQFSTSIYRANIPDADGSGRIALRGHVCRHMLDITPWLMVMLPLRLGEFASRVVARVCVSLIYLLFLAFKIAQRWPVQRHPTRQALSFSTSRWFQWVNPQSLAFRGGSSITIYCPLPRLFLPAW